MAPFLSPTLPGTTRPPLPYVFVGDEAFPLKENMLRPRMNELVKKKRVLVENRKRRKRNEAIKSNAFAYVHVHVHAYICRKNYF